MAAVRELEFEQYDEVEVRPYLRLVTIDPAPALRHGPSVTQRRAARARMLRRRRRTLLALALVTGLVILALPGPAFGGTTGAGLPTDLATSSVLASGTVYVVHGGDTVSSIAARMNPLDPSVARRALVAELHSTVVVPGEHVLIP